MTSYDSRERADRTRGGDERLTNRAGFRGFLVGGTLLAAASLFLPAQAGAQTEELLNTRSDVTLGIVGTRGTTQERLQQLTDRVTDQMGAVRKCYGDLVSRRPATVGAMKIRIILEAGAAPPQVDVKEEGGTDPELSACIRKVFRGMQTRGLGRPSAGIVTLKFDNTRAEGQKALAHHVAKQAAKLDIEAKAGGGFLGRWAAADKRVSVEVHGADRAAVEGMVRTLKARYAGLIDCRRRANKRGMSPAGVSSVSLDVARSGKGKAKVKKSTVKHRAVPRCLETALRKIDYQAPGHVTLEITFR